MPHDAWLEKMQKRMDWENEQADLGVEPYASSKKRFQEKMNEWREFWKYNTIVPPQMYRFLIAINMPFRHEELKKILDKGGTIYRVYTLMHKNKKAYNPEFYVNRRYFDVVSALIARNGSSIGIDSKIIFFDAKNQELSVYGLVTQMKKESDRYKLCNYLFGKKRGRPDFWEVEDILNELDDAGIYKNKPQKARYDWVNGKIRELNKDVANSIGIHEIVSYEDGRFVENPVNKPLR